MKDLAFILAANIALAVILYLFLYLQFSRKLYKLRRGEIREDVNRPETVKIKYFDENFKEHVETYSGFVARIIQHEYDHLDGKLFIDYLTPLKKRLLKGKLNNIAKGKITPHYRIKIPK